MRSVEFETRWSNARSGQGKLAHEIHHDVRLLFLTCRSGRQDGGERGGRDEHHGRHGARRGHQAQRPQAEAQEQVRIGQ